MQVLQRLGPFDDPRLLVGNEGFEDAGVFRLDATRALVLTVDFFPPIVDDPRWFGRIAAANSLSDVYAMGGRPLVALNLVGWPKDLDLELLGEVLAGGADKLREAGAVLAGGHSVVDAEIKYGMSVTGEVHPERFWRNGGAKLGDVLLLTKPLGMGPVATAIKKGAVDDVTCRRAMELMATLNRGACEAVADLDVHGATDVTGFGLMGHAHEMASGAGLRLVLEAARLPVFAEALDLARRGFASGACKRGRQYLAGRAVTAPGVDPVLADVCYDAETSGGLLLAIGVRDAEAAIRRLVEAGAPTAAIIGEFTTGETGVELR